VRCVFPYDLGNERLGVSGCVRLTAMRLASSSMTGDTRHDKPLP
jgi:hypothetical protein